MQKMSLNSIAIVSVIYYYHNHQMFSNFQLSIPICPESCERHSQNVHAGMEPQVLVLRMKTQHNMKEV